MKLPREMLNLSSRELGNSTQSSQINIRSTQGPDINCDLLTGTIKCQFLIEICLRSQNRRIHFFLSSPISFASILKLFTHLFTHLFTQFQISRFIHLKINILCLSIVEPGGVEPPSKQATPAAFSMLSPRLVFDQGLTVDGPPLT